MKKKCFIYFLVIGILLLTGCKTKDVTTAAYHGYETECLGKSMDGSQTVRVWASGRNRTDAMEQAKKKAVYDMVFTGVQAGSGDCNAYPIVDEANARKKYEDYFNLFFADGGDYKAFVSIASQDKAEMQTFHGNGRQTLGIIVTVNRSALRQRLVNDNIIIKK